MKVNSCSQSKLTTLIKNPNSRLRCQYLVVVYSVFEKADTLSRSKGTKGNILVDTLATSIKLKNVHRVVTDGRITSHLQSYQINHQKSQNIREIRHKLSFLKEYSYNTLFDIAHLWSLVCAVISVTTLYSCIYFSSSFREHVFS